MTALSIENIVTQLAILYHEEQPLNPDVFKTINPFLAAELRSGKYSLANIYHNLAELVKTPSNNPKGIQLKIKSLRESTDVIPENLKFKGKKKKEHVFRRIAELDAQGKRVLSTSVVPKNSALRKAGEEEFGSWFAAVQHFSAKLKEAGDIQWYEEFQSHFESPHKGKKREGIRGRLKTQNLSKEQVLSSLYQKYKEGKPLKSSLFQKATVIGRSTYEHFESPADARDMLANQCEYLTLFSEAEEIRSFGRRVRKTKETNTNSSTKRLKLKDYSIEKLFEIFDELRLSGKKITTAHVLPNTIPYKFAKETFGSVKEAKKAYENTIQGPQLEQKESKRSRIKSLEELTQERLFARFDEIYESGRTINATTLGSKSAYAEYAKENYDSIINAREQFFDYKETTDKEFVRPKPKRKGLKRTNLEQKANLESKINPVNETTPITKPHNQSSRTLKTKEIAKKVWEQRQVNIKDKAYDESIPDFIQNNLDNLTDREREIFTGINYRNKTFLHYADRWNIPDRAKVANVLRSAYKKISQTKEFKERQFIKSLRSQYLPKQWIL